jgi:hypothetical protein
LPDVGLVVDAVQDPLADVAFEVQQQVGDGILVIAATVPELFFVEFADASGDSSLALAHTGRGVREEVFGYGWHGGDCIVWRGRT